MDSLILTSIYLCVDYIDANRMERMQKKTTRERETSAVHVWLVLWKAFGAVASVAEDSIRETCLGTSDFRVLEVLLHKGPLLVNTIGPKVHLTPGSISVAIDRLEDKGMVRRRSLADDRRIRQVELTAKGRESISRSFRKHADTMESAMSELSAAERATLLELLKKLGRAAAKFPND